MAQQPRPTKLVVATPNEIRAFGRGDFVHPTALGVLARQRVAQWTHDVGDTTWSTMGSDRTPLQVGTGVPTAGDGATGAFETQTTLLASGDSAGRISGKAAAFATLTQRAWAPTMGFRIATAASITLLGFWVGLADADLATTPTPTTNHLAAFRYYVGTDGTAFWRAVTGDGSANTTTTTTRAAAASTTYEGLIEVDPDVPEVRFWMTDASGIWQLYATHTTNLPGLTTAMGWIATVATTSGVATGKKIAIDYISLTQR
jgi:hypothetical protein